MKSIKFSKKSLESILIDDPLNNHQFTFGQLFSTAENLKKQKKGNNLIISSNPYLIISFVVKCWLENKIPAVISPNLDIKDYYSVIQEIGFEEIITDDRLLSKSLKTPFFEFKKNTSKFVKKNLDFFYEPKNIALILFSSGTTGNQKAIPLTFNNIISNINAFKNRFLISESTTFLCTSPIWFAHGLYNSFLHAFFLQKKVIYSGVLNVFNGIKILEYCINKSNIIFHLTPSMIPILASLAQRIKTNSLPKFQYVICGTSFLDSKAKLYFEKIFKVDLIQQYGMTEVLFISFNDKPIEKPNSVGKPLPIVDVKISYENSFISSNEGRIFIKSPSFCGGYFNNSEIIDVDDNGYFFTGDLGYLDHEGYLYVTGREKDIIKKGGLSISASKINNTIKEFGNIRDAYTLGIVDNHLGEDIYSFIVIESEIKIEQLKKFLKLKLPINSIPKKIFDIKEIPKNEMGKISKNELVKIIEKYNV